MAVTAYGFTYNQGPYVYNQGTTASSELVPSVLPVALDGKAYMVDDAMQEAWQHESIPLLREQFDARDTPGEQSVNPAGYWRRAEEDWRLGTGQAHYDRPTSVAERYANSKGVDPFQQEWELSLEAAPQTYDDTVAYTDADDMTTAGTYLYATFGTTLRRSANAATPLTLWHTFASTITSMQSDGYWVYVAEGTNLWRFARDAADPGIVWSTGPIYTELGTVKDRVLAASGNLLYEIDSAGIEEVIYTGPSPDWSVVDITEGEGFIWFGGGAGDKYSIYSIDVLDDGTGLAPAQVAGELPEGEIITALQGYLNFVLVGVDRGVRLTVPTRDGDVTIGALLDIDRSVESFEGQGSLVAFEWENFDNISSGIGLLDLSRFTDAEGLVPAYTSSTMVDGATHINSITRREDDIYFLAVGVGIVSVALSDPAAPRVDSGFFESGWINWNLPAEAKQLAWVRLDTNGLGKYLIELKQDDGDYRVVAQVAQKRNRIAVEDRGIRFQYRITAIQDGGNLPVIYGAALESYVAADTTAYISVPLILARMIRFENFEMGMDVQSTLSGLKSLRENRTLFTYQEGQVRHTVIMEDYRWIPMSFDDEDVSRGTWDGTFVAQMKVIERSLGTGVTALTP